MVVMRDKSCMTMTHLRVKTTPPLLEQTTTILSERCKRLLQRPVASVFRKEAKESISNGNKLNTTVWICAAKSGYPNGHEVKVRASASKDVKMCARFVHLLHFRLPRRCYHLSTISYVVIFVKIRLL